MSPISALRKSGTLTMCQRVLGGGAEPSQARNARLTKALENRGRTADTMWARVCHQ
jgi:hypothetical protein